MATTYAQEHTHATLGGGELEDVGVETGQGDGEGLRVSELLWEGVPEPGSCPGKGPVPETAAVGLGDRKPV